MAALFSLYVLSLLEQPAQRGAGLAATIVLVTPFSYFYDSTMLVGSAAFLLRGAKGPAEQLQIAAVALLPGLWFETGGPWGALTALLLLALTLSQAKPAVQIEFSR